MDELNSGRRPPGPGLRVLVVDDNPDMLEILEMFLEGAGHAVECAAGGVDALAKAHRSPPDAALIDLGMPEVDGYQVARSFRNDEALQATFLVAVTGWSAAKHREAAAVAGFNRFFVKPVDLEALLHCLSELSAHRAALVKRRSGQQVATASSRVRPMLP